MFRKNETRKPKEISAGSMADIAFLLLIFFLVATTINDEKGISTKLNPYHPDSIILADERKNAFVEIYLNANGNYMFDSKRTTIIDLKKSLLIAINNNRNIDKQTIINITHDRGTSYKDYLACLNLIEASYNYLWEIDSMEKYKKSYTDLTKTQKMLINKDIPKLISEKEPTQHGEEIVSQ